MEPPKPVPITTTLKCSVAIRLQKSYRKQRHKALGWWPEAVCPHLTPPQVILILL